MTGNVDMDGASFDGDLDADSLQVGGPLYMRSDDNNKASFKNVTLSGAKVAGDVDLSGAQVKGELDADSLQVGGSLYMRSDDNNKASFKNVNFERREGHGPH